MCGRESRFVDFPVEWFHPLVRVGLQWRHRTKSAVLRNSSYWPPCTIKTKTLEFGIPKGSGLRWEAMRDGDRDIHCTRAWVKSERVAIMDGWKLWKQRRWICAFRVSSDRKMDCLVEIRMWVASTPNGQIVGFGSNWLTADSFFCLTMTHGTIWLKYVGQNRKFPRKH